MAKIPKYKLSKEFLTQYAKEQTDKYLSVEPIDESVAEGHIIEAYKVAKLHAPSRIIWYASPKHFIDSVRASVWASVWASVRDSVGASVRDSVGASVWASVWASVRASVWASVWASVGDSVRAWGNAGYDSWLKYFNDHQEENDFRHMCLFDEMVNGYYLTADTVHIIRKPIFLSRDVTGRLDSDAKMAIEWRDGYGFYYLHGVEFPEDTWKLIVNQKFTLNDLVRGNLNAQQRPVAIQMLRPELLLKQVSAELINTGKKGTKLYEVKNFMDTGDTEYCMLMTHPTIADKQYIEWVEPKVGKLADADLCQAKAFGITKSQYLNAKEA